MSAIWIIKLLLSHLLTDFLLQKGTWVTQRRQKHFRSPYLYLHTFLTAAVALLFIGPAYWPVALVILVSHTLIDGWKSYRPDTVGYFLLDQLLHLLVLLGCWLVCFTSVTELALFGERLNNDPSFWTCVTAYIFLTAPASILIGELTKKWRLGLKDPGALANAGRWIGIIERLLILTLVLEGQFEAIGLLTAAKTIVRFIDNDRTEQKTEYLLIGTLLSVGIAILTGLAVQKLTAIL